MMNIINKNIDIMNTNIVITIVASIQKNGDTKERVVQELYQTMLLTMSAIQAKTACLPLDLA
jgi:2C-methyl-D-erythritol 2,4-cyclodiphosphate synthase